MSKDLVVKCPTCNRSYKYYSSKYRPFCTDKCKLIDLGHWFDESYTIDGTSGTVYIEDKDNFNPDLDNEN